MATVADPTAPTERAFRAADANGVGQVTVVYEDDQAHVPAWVSDLESFCRWADSEEFPDVGRIWYLKGEVWVDMSKEEVFTHVLLKSRFFIVLGALVDAGRLGRFY